MDETYNYVICTRVQINRDKLPLCYLYCLCTVQQNYNYITHLQHYLLISFVDSLQRKSRILIINDTDIVMVIIIITNNNN